MDSGTWNRDLDRHLIACGIEGGVGNVACARVTGDTGPDTDPGSHSGFSLGLDIDFW